MSTFVIRLVDKAADSLKGKVQHVGTGEEATFASAPELIAFIEGIRAMQGPTVGDSSRSGLGEVPVDQRGRPRGPKE